MKMESHDWIAFSLFAAFLVAATGFAQELPPDEAWKPITVGDQKGYVVPNEVLDDLGLPPRTLPPEENAATYYLQAIEALEARYEGFANSELGDAFQKAIGRNPPDRLPDVLLEWFETTAPGRDLIKKASALDRCQFPVIVGKPGAVFLYGVLLPHLAPMRQSARLMLIEGRRHEDNAEPEKAMEAYLVIFRIAAHAVQGDSLIAGLVGIACHSIGTGAMERLLVAESLNAGALERLQHELEAIGLRLPARTRWIPMECAASKQMVDMAMKSPGSALAMTGADTGIARVERAGLATFLQSRAWRIMFPDRTLKRDFDRFYDRTREIGASPSWQAIAHWRQWEGEAQIADAIHDWNILAWLLLPALDRADAEYVKMWTRHEALRLNVALRRYKAVYGACPETLDVLAPEFVDVLPLDPFSGEPFHYRLDDDRWTLWSVGFDQDDDGGKIIARDLREDGDMVWDSAGEEGAK